jgi:hypothetical protein
MVVVSRRAHTHRGMVVGEHRDEEEREKQEEDPLTEHLHGRQIGEERRGRFMRLESADDHSHDRPRHVRLQHGNPKWRRRRGREGYGIRRHALLRRGERVGRLDLGREG